MYKMIIIERVNLRTELASRRYPRAVFQDACASQLAFCEPMDMLIKVLAGDSRTEEDDFGKTSITDDCMQMPACR